MKTAKETKFNTPKHADYKLQIKKKKTNITQKLTAYLKNLLIVQFPLIYLSETLNENIKPSLIKLHCDIKLISHFNPALKN